MRRICVFCGSSGGSRTSYAEAARQLGALLAREGLGVVYGGARVGLMGEVADAALTAGGAVIGVIPRALMEKELAHQGLTELHVVSSMHERKAMMAELSDGFVAMPGGFGTLEEVCEIVTWAQLGIHHKPCGLLNVDGYFDHLTAFLDNCVRQEFLRQQHRDMLLVADDPRSLLELLRGYRPPLVQKWIEPRQT